MQKIIPHLWFDKEAQQAAEFYAQVFPNAHADTPQTLHDTPSGDAAHVSFEIAGYRFMAISAGPYFKINPSISFMLNFTETTHPHAREQINTLWEKLSEGGSVLMPLQEYDFSKWYGWVQDKYGVSWQLMLANPEGEQRPFIVPSLLFTKERTGKTQEAINFYTSIFNTSKVGMVAKYPAAAKPDPQSTVMYADFMLAGQWFAAMDGGMMHEFTFSEATSFVVSCDSQEEIDYFWGKLSAVPESEQCGWLKDKFGISWQITPSSMNKMMSEGTPEQVQRVTQAFLKMKKFDIAALESAYAGE